jgi:CBS domain-containing protein
MSELTARDLMTKEVIVAQADWSVEQLAELLMSRAITGAPVVDEHGKFVGVVSLTDLSRSRSVAGERVQGEHMHDFYIQALKSRVGSELARTMNVIDDPELTVREIMTPVVFDIEPNASPREIAEKMLTGRIHRLFVTDAGKIVGVITSLDMLRVIRDMS